MTGYILIYRLFGQHFAPPIGIERNNISVFVITQPVRSLETAINYDIYKVAFTPRGSKTSSMWGDGYVIHGYTVLELV